MAVNQNGPLVDTNMNTYDGRTPGTVSSILGARDETRTAASTQAKNLAETHQAMIEFTKNIKNTIESLDESFKKSKGFKDFEKQLKAYEQAFSDTSAIINRGSTDIATLAKTVEKANNAYDEMNVALAEMTTINQQNVKDVKDLNAEKKAEINLNKQDLKLRKEIRAKQRKEIIDAAKEGSKDLGKAISSMAGDLAKGLSNIKTALSLDSINSQLANGATRSTFAQVQLQTMNSMNLSRSEFNKFKKDLYNQVDTSIYSNTEIRDAIATFGDMGLNSTTDAISKMNVIIQGQKLLGLNAEQQTRLQQYSNRTGRDSLTFQTNRMAKWMQMSNNLGQKQLAELVDLNTNMLMQFADMGVSSKSFENSNTAATAAITALTGNANYAGYYTNMLTGLATSTSLAAPAVGMSAGDVKLRLDAGQTGADLIYGSSGTYNELYNLFMRDFAGTVANLDHYIEGLEGLNAETAAYIKQMAEYDRKYGRGAFGNYLRTYDVDAADASARAEMEKNMSAATGMIAKWVNSTGNWITKIADWTDLSNIETSLTIIIGLLTTIASMNALQDLGSLFKGGSKLLGKGTKAFNASKMGKALYSGKLGSGGLGLVSKTGTAGLSTAGGLLAGASILGGLAWGGAGAINSVKNADANYGEGHKVGAGISGFFAGSTVHKDAKGNVSTAKNVGFGAASGAVKGALIGAGLGSIIPGLGTAVGGAVGAAIGGVGGLVSGIWKNSKAKEQEEREKAQLKAQQEIAENTANSNRLLGSQVALSQANRNVTSVRSYIGNNIQNNSNSGDGPTFSPSALPKVTPTNGMGAGTARKYPWKVTSPFGERTLSNGDKSFHRGIDFGIATGTPIGAPVNGTITSTKWDPRNTYKIKDKSGGTWIYMTGADGVKYSFGHLSALGVKKGDKVNAGQTIGLSGNTGYSTGPHLHFAAMVGGNYENPDPNYITNGLFSADGKMITYSPTSSLDVPDSRFTTTGTQSVFTTKLRSLSSPSDGMGAVVTGLSEIKQTLIDLSEKQTRDEQILSMLQGSKKQEPRTV